MPYFLIHGNLFQWGSFFFESRCFIGVATPRKAHISMKDDGVAAMRDLAIVYGVEQIR